MGKMTEIYDVGFGNRLNEFSFHVWDNTEKMIYLLIDDYPERSEVVYVGQSEGSVFNRINSHIKDEGKEFNKVFAFKTENIKHTLDEIEHAFISYYQPKYNIAFKGSVIQKDFLIMSEFLYYLKKTRKDNDPTT